MIGLCELCVSSFVSSVVKLRIAFYHRELRDFTRRTQRGHFFIFGAKLVIWVHNFIVLKLYI